MNSSLTGLVSSYKLLRSTEHEFVLATIIQTEGSTYRKAGARMLITKSGQYYGLLGGGCFEADLLEHAAKVFASRQPVSVYYDMRAPEDLIWGLGLGCNGAVRILLEYLGEENDYSPISLIESALESRQRSVVITVCESMHNSIVTGRQYCISGKTDEVTSNHLPEVIYDRARSVLESGQSVLETILVDRTPLKVFFSCITPPVSLAIIGAGPDAVPVTQAAKLLGWRVSVIDYRESYTRAENFPAADQVILCTPENMVEEFDLSGVDAVVLMTHKFEYDLRYLQVIAGTAIPYIGLLGPVARRDELLRSIEANELARIKKNIYGPVGMDIGGELPEDIAFSLIAEIQAVMHNRKGGHLSEITSARESTQTDKLATVVLAAGGSTRFGALKQLLEFNGKSLLKRTVEMALKLPGKEVLVVHGPKATKCQREISGLNVSSIVNNDWESGLSSSLKLAIKTVPTECEAVLVLLCDQPLIEIRHLNLLLSTWKDNPGKIIASQYAGTAGVPAIIPESCFGEINRLKGDSGARHIIAAFEKIVVPVPIPEAEYDIDTEQDFARLLEINPVQNPVQVRVCD